MSEVKKTNLKEFSRAAPIEENKIRVDLIYVLDKINVLSDVYLSSLGYLLNINHFNHVQNYFEEFVKLSEDLNDDIDIYELDQLIKHENKFKIMSSFKNDLQYMLTQIIFILEKIKILQSQINTLEDEIENEKVKAPIIKVDHKLTHITNLILDMKRSIEAVNNTNIQPFIKQLPGDSEKAIVEIEKRVDLIKKTVNDMFDLQNTKRSLLQTITNK